MNWEDMISGYPADMVKAVKAGDAEAQYGLGVLMLDDGDFKEVAKWWRKAAEQGHADAQYGLGHLYDAGVEVVGIGMDKEEAVKWYRKSAKQGHAEAQYNLGRILCGPKAKGGKGVAAYAWFDLAAYNGVENALKNRAIVAKHMTQEQISKAQKRSRKRLKKIEAKKAKKK